MRKSSLPLALLAIAAALAPATPAVAQSNGNAYRIGPVFRPQVNPSFSTFNRCGVVNTGAAGSTGPCSGPPGTRITMQLERNLSSRPAFLVFRQVIVNGVPATVRVTLSGGGTQAGTRYNIPAPRQLCVGNGGLWEVQLITANLQSEGTVGGFRPFC